MKALLIIFMLLLSMPCLATGIHAEKRVYIEADRAFLYEIMTTQARMGIAICGIAAEWRLKGYEFMELGESGPKLAEAVEELSGRLPEPVAVKAPDFTKERGMLLRQAAKILGEADILILKLYERKVVDEDAMVKLENMNAKVRKLLLNVAQ